MNIFKMQFFTLGAKPEDRLVLTIEDGQTYKTTV